MEAHERANLTSEAVSTSHNDSGLNEVALDNAVTRDSADVAGVNARPGNEVELDNVVTRDSAREIAGINAVPGNDIVANGVTEHELVKPGDTIINGAFPKDADAVADPAKRKSLSDEADGLEVIKGKDAQPNGMDGSKDCVAQKPQENATMTSFRLIECMPTTMRARAAPRKNGRDPHLKWAKTTTGQYIPVRNTTCIPGLENRQRDKARVEAELGLSEFGDNFTQFYLRTADGTPSVLIGIGFERIVYGDHGPYIELAKNQVNWETFPIVVEKPEHAFYDEYFTSCRTLMLYAQKRPVFHKKNPPPGEWSQANNREEGYANYLSGKHYVEASVDKIYVFDPSKVQWQYYSDWQAWQGQEWGSN